MFLSNISSIFKMGILNYLFWCQTYAAINNILCFFIFHSDVIFYYSFVFFITHIATCYIYSPVICSPYILAKSMRAENS